MQTHNHPPRAWLVLAALTAGLLTAPWPAHRALVAPDGRARPEPPIAVAAAPVITYTVFLPAALGAQGVPRPWPDTTAGIHVFNDQLAPWMTEPQWQFAATHYAGAQKMLRADANHLRALNPGFLILHYRLGHGLGYRAIENGCQPTGTWLQIIEGDNWVQEWPGAGVVQENWFFHWPEAGGPRVLNCDWGWYLMELDDPAWRTYWQAEVLRQVQANDDDGVFVDSLSVPNYLGASSYDPPLPANDPAFESAWAARIENWLAWLQTRPLGGYYVVPNVGSWITMRDPTDYSAVDGVMLEGFAIEADASPYNLDDWRLQMNRALSLIAPGKAVIGQTYVMGARERMFALGSYLLIKGNRTFINVDLDMEPEWWPEYEIPVGAPLHSAGTDIENLYDPADLVYRRNFANGQVLVNPTSPWDGTALTATLSLGGTFYLAQPSGGGLVPPDGVPTGTLNYSAVTQVVLPPYSAVVLLNARP
jgi:hypothetical protein